MIELYKVCFFVGCLVSWVIIGISFIKQARTALENNDTRSALVFVTFFVISLIMSYSLIAL